MTFTKLNLKLKSCLLSAIYTKTLQCAATSSVSVTNLMAFDVDRFRNGVVAFQPILFIFTQTIGCIVYLYFLLGWSALAGVGVLILYAPLSVWYNKQMDKVNSALMEARDQRTKLTSELFGVSTTPFSHRIEIENHSDLILEHIPDQDVLLGASSERASRRSSNHRDEVYPEVQLPTGC